MVGIFVGVQYQSGPHLSNQNVFSGTSGACSIASGRLSYTHGLTGPCVSLDTACSSSLVAFHDASRALEKQECYLVVISGTNALSAQGNLGAAASGMISPLGRCHTFDSRANGYCRAEGCVSFLGRIWDHQISRLEVVASAV